MRRICTVVLCLALAASAGSITPRAMADSVQERLDRARAQKAQAEVTIAKAGRPVARLIPVEGPGRRRMPGSARGQVVIGPDFDDPLPDDIRRAFES